MPAPRFSVVTLSLNQGAYLERAIRSVLDQRWHDVEYIVVDPGSTDGSRETIERYRDQLAHVLFEPDQGPADGLNKGLDRITGDVFCYLNADDCFEPGAFATAAEAFERAPDTDILCGHAWVVDAFDRPIRRVWSDPFDAVSVAYGTSIHIQPSTFFRRRVCDLARFNVENRCSWDAEFLADAVLAGARVEVIDAYPSRYRLHPASITVSGSRDSERPVWDRRRFQKLVGRDWRRSDRLLQAIYFARRQARNPAACLERLRRGPVYMRRL